MIDVELIAKQTNRGRRIAKGVFPGGIMEKHRRTKSSFSISSFPTQEDNCTQWENRPCWLGKQSSSCPVLSLRDTVVPAKQSPRPIQTDFHLKERNSAGA